ncbi:MAG: beta-ketoacyl-ACP reductase [Bacteroidales bacterium]|nr:beta-ketoacyl-ACP reductase [Bacteroidales bacterium]
MGILEGKVALITGGTRNIGKAISLLFAKEGADIAITCRHIGDEARDTIGRIEALGRKVKCYESDATDFKASHEVVDDVVRTFGHLDILVNNAGIIKDTLILRMTEEDFDSVLNADLKSAFNYTHAAAPYMARARKGSIVYMSSIVGVSGNPGQSNYAAAKAGLIGFSKSIAKELGSRGVRSNCLAPGLISSEMAAGIPDELRDFWLKRISLHREGTLDEVAGVALFLASDQSSYITGQVINCCGGLAD